MLLVTLTLKVLPFFHKDCVPFFKKFQLYTILYASVIWNTLATLYKSWIIEYHLPSCVQQYNLLGTSYWSMQISDSSIEQNLFDISACADAFIDDS